MRTKAYSAVASPGFMCACERTGLGAENGSHPACAGCRNCWAGEPVSSGSDSRLTEVAAQLAPHRAWAQWALKNQERPLARALLSHYPDYLGW